ncbi:MAG: hypothetical protein AAGH15_21350, partial [Myxococcota bacterium]
GLGVASIATYDGSAEPHVFAAETRELVRHAMDARGAGDVPLDVDLEGNGRVGGSLRASLDPNEGFRPALALVALVLLLYVVVVGPMNFGYVARKGRPTLALLTTPAAALGCFLVLLVVGYVGKGTSLRHRTVALLELTEGQTRGLERRYRGLFTTRPLSFDLPVEPGVAVRLLAESRDREPLRLHDGAARTLHDLRGGLWETIFLQEQEVRRFGGRVRFERRSEGGPIAAIRNELAEPLLGAVLVAPGGALYPVGDVPPGRSAPLGPAAATGTAPTGTSNATPAEVAQHLGLEEIEEREAFAGLFRDRWTDLSRGTAVLWARMPAPEKTIGDRFAPEREQRFVRIVAPRSGVSIADRGELLDAATGLGNLGQIGVGRSEVGTGDEEETP